MTYQPLKWDIKQLLKLGENKINITDIFQNKQEEYFERFSFDRATAIASFLRKSNRKLTSALDLGSSGGVFSVVLKMALDLHVTSVDDDRYILVQGEEKNSSIEEMENRLQQHNIKDILPVNSSIESFVHNCPPFPIYDVVLLLNVLHHFYTGYGQCSDYGQMNWEETMELIRKIGSITSNFLFFEINSKVIKEYEHYLSEIMYSGGFKTMQYITSSTATDGQTRIVWCFIK